MRIDRPVWPAAPRMVGLVLVNMPRAVEMWENWMILGNDPWLCVRVVQTAPRQVLREIVVGKY